jgi:hypothetical protein
MKKAALLLAFAMLPQAHAAECTTPAKPTEDHQIKRLRQTLESFRQDAEQRRAAAEADRLVSATDKVEYRQAIATYRDDLAAYRAAVRSARDSACPFAANDVFGLDVLPGELDSQYDLAHGNDAVMLRIRYYYTGDHGAEVSMGALTYLDGNSTGHWAYRPYRLAPGFHVALVRLSMSMEAPNGYRSDEIKTEMYVHGKSVFHSRRFPFVHEWRRRSTANITRP